MRRLQILNDVTSLKSTDNATPVELALLNEYATRVDLTTFKEITVKVATYQGLFLFDEDVVLGVDGTSLLFTMSHGLPAGKYLIEVHFVDQDDKLTIAPNEGPFVFNIERSLNELGEVVSAISVEKLLKDMAETLQIANDANLTANDAKGTSLIALDRSNEAIDIANTAASKVSDAVDVANASNQLANEANDKSDTAINQANLAVDQSTDALDKATQSVATSNDAKADAELAKTQSDTALSNSLIAKNDASEALTKANQAIAESANTTLVAQEASKKAEQASLDSASSLSNSLQAISDSSNALQIANEAKTKADQSTLDSSNALVKADEANNKSDTAISTANAADLKADKAIVDSSTALKQSSNAETLAIEAKDKSETAITDSSTALQQSSEALTKANQAEKDSASSLLIANETKVLVDDAVNTVNQFKTVAETAKTASDLATATSQDAITLATQSATDATQAVTDSSNALAIANEAKVKAQEAKDESLSAKTESSNAISIAQTVEAKFKLLTEGNTDTEVYDARNGFDSLGERLDAIENAMQTAPSYVYTSHKQRFLSDGTQIDYVIDVVNIEENDIVYVYQNGIKLTVYDYALNGNIVTIIPPLDEDTEVYVEILKRELASGTSSEGSVITPATPNMDIYYHKNEVDNLIADLQAQINALSNGGTSTFSVSNYNAVDSYWTKNGEGAETFTFNKECTGFAVVNLSENDMTVKIGDIEFVVASYENFEDAFKPFTQLTINVEGEYKAIVRSNVTVTNPDGTGYNAINAYWTSEGNGIENYSFTEQCTDFEISNTGEAAITVKIGEIEFVVDAGEMFSDSFSPFTEVTITATSSYRAIVRSNTPLPDNAGGI